MKENAPEKMRGALPPTSRSLPISLIRAREAVMAPVRAMLQESGISEQQWRILRVLGEAGSVDVTSLSERAGLLAPSATRIVHAMHEKGYISRQTDPKDRRRQVVSLLPKGRDVLAANHDRALALAGDFKAKLGEKDYELLLDLLERLSSHRSRP